MKPLIEYDKQTILSEEVFIEIFEQQDEIMKARMLLSCQERAKDLGVKQSFDNLVKAYKNVERATRKQQSGGSLLENWTNFTGTYDNMKCGAWIASDEGIRTFNKDYTNEVIVCYHPILPVKRMKNIETGEEQLRIAYKRNYSWKEITVPKNVVASSNKIVALSGLGIAVTSENAKLLVKYLSDVENLNDNDIPVQLSTTKLGWIGDGFVPYDTDVEFDGDTQFKYVFNSIKEYGSKDTWMDYVRNLRKSGRIEIQFALAASFASVLVGVIDALPFIVDLWGESGSGKTVAMMMAASVWADPKEHQFIGDFESSDVQLEVRADMLNHLPMMLDDTSKVSDKIKSFEDFVYRLCSGKGKSRSNKDLGIRRENHWQNCIMTNGEHPLASYVNQGGAINRILEIECEKGIFKDPQGALDVFKKNYGHAGQQFVKIVKNLGGDEILRIQREIQNQILDEEKTEKQSISLSVILTADKIVSEHMFYDECMDFEQAKAFLASASDISENERCYQYLLDKIAMNEQRFDKDTNCEKWGVLEPDYAFLHVQAFNELCEAGRFSKKAFLSWASRNGVIQPDNKGNPAKLKKIKGKPLRCVCLKLNPDMDKDGFSPVEYEQEELPFT